MRFVDFHAEVTSEKMAMGWYLDGRVSAMVGTHTHIPTADTRILPGGSAYQTDVGMTGPYDSVIGVKKELILQRFLTALPVRMEAAKSSPELHSVILEVDEVTGKAISMRRHTVRGDFAGNIARRVDASFAGVTHLLTVRLLSTFLLEYPAEDEPRSLVCASEHGVSRQSWGHCDVSQTTLSSVRATAPPAAVARRK